MFAQGGQASFDQVNMMINFNDVKKIPLGVHEVTVEVRQKTETGELSDVAYSEKFKIHVASFSDLAFELDDLKV